MCFKLTVQEIRRDIAGPERFGHPPIRIRLAEWAEEIVFPHQSPYLLGIHDDPHVEQSHIDAENALLVAAEIVCRQDQLEICSVLLLPFVPRSFRRYPPVIAGTRYAGDFAQRSNAEGRITILERFVDDLIDR